MIKVMGIDPGLASTGIGIVWGWGHRLGGCSYGCIRTDAAQETPRRLEKIHSSIGRVAASEKPALMIVEEVFSMGRHPKSGLSLGRVSGVVMLSAAQAGIPVKEVAVREAKQVLTGNGNATKEQLEEAVRVRLGLDTPIRPFHASDALGLAIIGLMRYSRQARPEGVAHADVTLL